MKRLPWLIRVGLAGIGGIAIGFLTGSAAGVADPTLFAAAGMDPGLIGGLVGAVGGLASGVVAGDS